MSASFGRAVVDGLRRHGVVVHEHPGCWTRGNGQRSDYRGGSMHHTATGYGAAPAILVNGRSDLAGPLCNTSGNADGSVTLIAVNPANHAGASGGRSMGPLPVTKSFNKHVWGHEIVYPGDKPMTPAQYRTACILAGVISGIVRARNPEVVRAHAETSITGKWDPGYAPGRTIDMSRFRGDVWPALHSGPPVPAPGQAPAPPPPPPPPPGRLTRMRSLNLANPDGSTPHLSGVLTIDAVGDSFVMPKGAEAWVQWHAFYPGTDMAKLTGPPPECWWLAFCDVAGNQQAALRPFALPFRASGAAKLPERCASVEIAVRNIPAGGSVGVHIDGRGHAP